MPSTLPYSPHEARQILATRQRQLEARTHNDAQLDTRVESINNARVDMENKLQDYLQKCDDLLTASRRITASESSTSYRTFASMQLRLGGAMKQALKRAEAGGLILSAAKAEKVATDRRAEEDRIRLEVRRSQRQVEKSLLPTHDDFETLYGDVDEDSSYAP